MVERCNKCKVSYRVGGDTWCIGCSAWETIGNELCARWTGPAGFRRIADDVALSAARHIRALRSLGAGTSPASGSLSAGAAKEEARSEGEGREREVPGLAAKARAVEPCSEYEYTYTEDEAGEPTPGPARPRGPDPRPALSRLGRSESVRRTENPAGQDLREVKVEKGIEEARKERPESPPTKKQKRSRSKQKEKVKSKKKDKKEGSGKRRKRRGGRKHQQLSRLAEDPFRPHHRRLGDEALAGGGSLDLPH